MKASSKNYLKKRNRVKRVIEQTTFTFTSFPDGFEEVVSIEPVEPQSRELAEQILSTLGINKPQEIEHN